MDENKTVVQSPSNCNYTTSFYEEKGVVKREVFICHKRDRRVSSSFCKGCSDWRKVSTKLFE